MSNMTSILVKLCILMLLYEYATCLVIPEELPTILSLIYSNIPPIKKGTDSRIGIGFRLGEHADFQMLFELGPQMETEPIGNTDTKRRRDAMLSAAVKGDLGPLAQAVAKYQLEHKLRKELEKLDMMEKKLKVVTSENNNKKTTGSEWLTKWSKEMTKSTEDQASVENISGEKNKSSIETQRIGQPPELNGDTISDLKKLYKSQSAIEEKES
ncbi:uncharacterized protein LOC105737441 isoform X2 [Apis florea]|nr:uncharacterized protein LOC105737441 isoform X2 [Apis florea]XP_012350894.1 uncharacterized protein LOC105737441 isoform X2 [Apis florea]XP_031776557.1 uncharacterized protein LOC105737441 isoform X2 [Apis florea]